jgi:hypothetical protein
MPKNKLIRECIFFLVSVTVFILVWWLVFQDVRKGIGYGITCSTAAIIGHWLIQSDNRRNDAGGFKKQGKIDPREKG